MHAVNQINFAVEKRSDFKINQDETSFRNLFLFILKIQRAILYLAKRTEGIINKKEPNRQKDRKVDKRQTDRQTDSRQTDKIQERQINKQNKQTNKEKQRASYKGWPDCTGE